MAPGSFGEFLERQPEGKRFRWALYATGAIVAGLAILWATILLPAQLRATRTPEAGLPEAELLQHVQDLPDFSLPSAELLTPTETVSPTASPSVSPIELIAPSSTPSPAAL